MGFFDKFNSTNKTSQTPVNQPVNQTASVDLRKKVSLLPS